MSLLMSLVLIMAVFFWIIAPRTEWSIPPNWEAAIKKWKERLSNKSHGVYVVCELVPENEELEKRVWLLHKKLPDLQQNAKYPINIELPIHHNLPSKQIERYIACLQRRFPDLNIYLTSISVRMVYEDTKKNL